MSTKDPYEILYSVVKFFGQFYKIRSRIRMIPTTTSIQHCTRVPSQLPTLRLKEMKCVMIRKILFEDDVSVYIEFYMNSIFYRIQRFYKTND